MSKQIACTWVIAGCLALVLFQKANAGLVNGGFESDDFGVGAQVDIVVASMVPGWSTTASDNKIEVWSNNFNGVTAYQGNQHAELNAFEESTLFQDVPGITANSIVGFQFAHRGRAGIDTMQFTLTDLGVDNILGGGNDTILFTQVVSDGNTVWGFYTGSGITALGNTARFSFASISATGGNQAIGNFLDDADFGVGVGLGLVTPEPSSFALFTVVGVALGCVAAWRRWTTARNTHCA